MKHVLQLVLVFSALACVQVASQVSPTNGYKSPVEIEMNVGLA